MPAKNTVGPKNLKGDGTASINSWHEFDEAAWQRWVRALKPA